MNIEISEDEIDEDFPHSEYIKYVCEGAETLSEVANSLKEFADYLLELESDGMQLIQPVDHGYVLFWNKDELN